MQEELIFRGLLQTVFARNLSAIAKTSPHASVAAVVGAALPFALVHLAVGPWTAVAALPLGLLAGALRQRSGSVVPPIIAHIIFNVRGLLVTSVPHEPHDTKTAGRFFKEPKNGKARTIALPAPIVLILEEHRTAQQGEREPLGEGCQDDDLVFARPDGSLVTPWCYTAAIKRLAKTACLLRL